MMMGDKKRARKRREENQRKGETKGHIYTRAGAENTVLCT
jgi:hypothetical protein